MKPTHLLTLILALAATPGALRQADAQSDTLQIDTLTVTGDLVVTNLTIDSGSVTLPNDQNASPSASFTATPFGGDYPLAVEVDATASTDSDGTIAAYDWSWGDGTANGSGVTANHTYTSAGDYTLRLTVTDDDGDTASAVWLIQVTTPSVTLPAYTLTAEETGYAHVEWSWTDDQTWSRPWIIQRSTTVNFVDPTDLTNNQAADNTGAGTFRFLGINADNYVDLDGLAENTRYYYRVAAVINLSDHYRSAATPTFSTWKYGEVTTGTLPGGQKQTYNVTSYGAVSGDGNNDYPAALAALAAAEAAGGGIVYFPAGTYDIWPTDGDVTYSGGQLSLASGQSAEKTLFPIQSDNITFLGDASGGNPTTFWNLYLWHKRPATEWLEALWEGSLYNQYRRYFVFKPYDVAQTTIKNIEVDMGAVPVNTGKAWQSSDAIKNEWDISHKFWAAHDTTRGKNTIFDTVIVRNCRGEIIYVGGSSEKMLIKDVLLERSNSSAISTSADLEMVRVTVKDASNAAVENIIVASRNGLDGNVFAQNNIARDCTFVGLDPAGIMVGLPGLKQFSGWHCFNDVGTYQSVTDSTFDDFVFSAFGPWYEYRDGLRFNCTFSDVAAGFSGALIYTNTSAQGDYELDGGMSNILWLGDTFYMNDTWPSGEVVFNSFPGAAALGNESPWIWDAAHFVNVGGGAKTLNRFWTDSWSLASGRQEVVFSNFTKDAGISLSGSYIYNTQPTLKIDPTYVNFFP